MKYTMVRIVVPSNQEWCDFQRPETAGIALPPHVGFTIGGVVSKGLGNRVLTLDTHGVKIQDGIDAALAIAGKLGLNATVAISDAHFSELVDEGRFAKIGYFGRLNSNS
jgi:hypothetical protein